ncbi:TetR/AcrR family transcriptional regulator [Rhodococcus sp. NPDC019627]|uniref:TetR/AcrR family transcriptional regulator n=1 Tax=unclassified Rhodococcus (in: high G+C Gram-positive bacteria) TaxID=192944 RepID=UPI0033FDEA08
MNGSEPLTAVTRAGAPRDESLSPGWQERRRRVAANIEHVALEMFTERGYSEVTVDEIGTRVGCSLRTVTRYFANKEDLLLDFHRRKNQVVLDEFARLEPTPDPASVIWAVWMALTLNTQSGLDGYLLWKKAAATAPEVMDRANGERRRSVQLALTAFISASLGIDPDTDMRPQLIAATLEAANSALVNFWVACGGVEDLYSMYQDAARSISELSVSILDAEAFSAIEAQR